MNIFEHIQVLYNNELYEEVINLHDLHPRGRGLSEKHEALLTVYVADSYFYTEKYRMAMTYYHHATQMYPHVPRGLSLKNFTDADVRYRYHKCLIKEKKFEEALGVLAKIPESDAPAKVRHAMGKLLSSRDHNPATAVNAANHYAAVLDICHSSFASAGLLLRQGFPIPAGVSLDNIPSDLSPVDVWLEAQKMVGQGDVKQAIQRLQSIPSSNYKVLVELGRLYYSLGMKEEARSELSKAHALDAEQVDGMDLLAKLYATDACYLKELESLGDQMMRDNASTIEANIVLGYLVRALDSPNTAALNIAHKACCMTSGTSLGGRATSEALLLKSLILKDMGRTDDALQHLIEALQGDPKNFDLYEAQIELHLHFNNMREAKTALHACLMHMPQDPRAQVLKAKVLMRTNSSTSKIDAQRILEPIAANYPYLLDAVWLLLEQYQRTCNYEKGVELLKKLTNSKFPYTSMGRLHHMLGDFLAKLNQPEAAYSEITIALNRYTPDNFTQMATLENAMMFTTPSPMAELPAGPPRVPRYRPPVSVSRATRAALRFDSPISTEESAPTVSDMDFSEGVVQPATSPP